MRIQTKVTAFVVAAACAAISLSTGLLAQSSAARTAGNGAYIAIDPLAGVSYDNRYDLSAGLAYRNMKAGPDLVDYGQLGGVDVHGSYWRYRNLGLEGTFRGYLGTAEAAPNVYGMKGQFIQNYFIAAGPEYLGPHNKHADLIAHAMFGGLYGKYEGDLHGKSPAVIDFYNDQFSPAAIIGGHLDLNRSARWALRITPDAVFTWMHQNTTNVNRSQMDVNFSLSVGVVYKFKTKR